MNGSAEDYKYVILGAGPAGLTFANRLLDAGVDSFLVLEKEETAGGLCRSEEAAGAPLDIGGGHFLDVRSPWIDDYLFRFMPRSEWDLYTRCSKIDVRGQLIDHPFEANIWQFPEADREAYLHSIAKAGCCLGLPAPEKFTDWIVWKLGRRIAEDYMLPYNRKMFSHDLDQLGTYWLSKLPDVSYGDTLRSCREHRAYAKQPGHAQFYYPKKYGYGEVWLRMGERLGTHLKTGCTVTGLDFDTRTVTARGNADTFSVTAGIVVNTIPWTCFDRLDGMPEELRRSTARLRTSALQIEYREDDPYPDSDAQWIYCPDPALSYHRVLERRNFLPGSRGCWTETNAERTEGNGNFRYMNRYAYPLNTIDKPAIMEQLLAFARRHGVYGLGRWGEHRHFNSDVTVERAIKLQQEIE
ncbi:MAG: NAD(P)-binding protein [Lachnospiraceae bacterium]|jgi:protoporphyrinogen oxidase|nr:NAD(P)-binding protein [Lachnospiraceae bacterium]